MLAEDALPACPRYSCELLVRVFQCIERFFGGVGEEDFLTGAQEAIEPFPGITQQGRAAGGRFEQAAGRTIPHGSHFAPGHVERQPRRTEEPRMPVGGHVTDEPEIVGPGKAIGITGAPQHEAFVPAAARGLDEQPLQSVLPVIGVSAEVGEIRAPQRIAGDGMMGQRIDVSVQGRDSPGAQQALEAVQCSAAGVAEYQVEVAQAADGQIVDVLSGIHSRQRNRCIQVVKHVERAGCCIEAQAGGDVGIGAVRGDDRSVRARNLARRQGRNCGPVAVKHQLGARKAREIPMRGVVRHVFLEEDNVMTARAQGADETAPQGCVPVSPG